MAKKAEVRCACSKLLTEGDGCPWIRGQLCEQYNAQHGVTTPPAFKLREPKPEEPLNFDAEEFEEMTEDELTEFG